MKKMQKATMTEYNDPWQDLTPPSQEMSVSGRRVDPEVPWNLYWALDVDSGCLLILRHESEQLAKARLPKFRGLEIEDRVSPEGSDSILMIRLKEEENRDLFHRLCLDIVEATRDADSEAEAVAVFLARTWRWHRLLRSGSEGRLTDDEQKGLIGELQLMRKHLLPCVGAASSVRAWRGPLGAPKDFEVGRTCIEAKARREAATPFVAISTEYQLDMDGLDDLFLYVLDVASAPIEDSKGVTVSDMARLTLEDVKTHDAGSVDLFEERLIASGFDWDEDYEDKKWILGAEHLFKVESDFPKITPSAYSEGVTNVRYSVALHSCERFRVDFALLTSVLGGDGGADQR